jgi:hypothetical protein
MVPGRDGQWHHPSPPRSVARSYSLKPPDSPQDSFSRNSLASPVPRPSNLSSRKLVEQYQWAAEQIQSVEVVGLMAAAGLGGIANRGVVLLLCIRFSCQFLVGFTASFCSCKRGVSDVFLVELRSKSSRLRLLD